MSRPIVKMKVLEMEPGDKFKLGGEFYYVRNVVPSVNVGIVNLIFTETKTSVLTHTMIIDESFTFKIHV